MIPESTIIADRADLALTTPDTTSTAIEEQGAAFTITGASYQANQILEPKDLIGKTLAVPPVDVITVNGIDLSRVNIVPYPRPILGHYKMTKMGMAPPVYH